MSKAEHHNGEDPLEAIAQQLHLLGAETVTERRVKRTVPWLMSLLIHAGIFVLALLVAGTVRLIQKEEAPPLIVADFDAITYDPLTRLDLDQAEIDQEVVQDQVPLDSFEQALDVPLETELDTLEFISDAASESPLARFEPEPVEGSATFVGVQTSNARRIVYVIDASGSLIASLQVVVQELGRSLDGLTALQQFSIVFFQQDLALAYPPGPKLTAATERAKIDAMEWIERTIIPHGNSNPLPALEVALRLGPDVIFLLSDNITGSGRYEIDQADLLSMLDTLNPQDPRTSRRRTQINCIQFLDPDPLDTLATIAREHGSASGYKFLDREELGLARP